MSDLELEKILDKYNNPEYISELNNKKKEYILNREKSKKHKKNIIIEDWLDNQKPDIKGW